MTQSKQNQNSNLFDPSPSSISTPALVVTVSGKQIDHAGKKKYVEQVTGRHDDTKLHLAARQGDLEAVKDILDEINSLMAGTLSGSDVAKIRASMVNELGETALYAAAEKGHVEVVKELLKYSDQETLATRSRLEFDPLLVAASQGHHAIVKLLLDHDLSLCQARSQGNATPLITAASKGHSAVVQELLSKDPTLLDVPRSNGKNALHLAARSGHVEIVKCLLEKDPQLARRMNKKGQTALHLAARLGHVETVVCLLENDPQLARRTDIKGQTALHMAVKGASKEVVNELLCLPYTNVNALTRDHKTALDIAEGLFPSEGSKEIQACLVRHGAVGALELNQPQDELRTTVAQIKNDVHKIAKDVRKGANNGTNSLTVAVLFATLSFATIFTIPSAENDDWVAVVVNRPSFQIFLVSNAFALYASLAVVLVQTTLVITGESETKTKRQVIHVSNMLLWLASVFTSVAFMVLAYIVVGRKHEWVAVLITVVGGVTMVGVLGTLMCYVVIARMEEISVIAREKTAKMMGNQINTIYH